MSQEFTPEQVAEMAGRIWDHTTDGHPAHLANLQTASAMLRAYAATLRQPAARVDEGMVPEYLKDPVNVHAMMLRGAIAIPSIRSMVDLRGEVPNGEDVQLERIAELQEKIAALEAALSAQPAPERQGEAVAKVRHFDYRGIARKGFSQEAEMLDGAPVVPDGTLLYTHTAAPVGVPDGDRCIRLIQMCFDVRESMHAYTEKFDKLPKGSASVEVEVLDLVGWCQVVSMAARGLRELKSPAAQAGVPDGWKLAPVEATEDMLKAVYPLHWYDSPGQRLKQDYHTLLAAAPSAPQGTQQGEG